MSLLIVLAFLTLFSCEREERPRSPHPPLTPVLTSESIWGVANKSYLKILSSPEPKSEVIAFLRQGDLAEVITKVGEVRGGAYWLEVRLLENPQTGWVRDTDMDVYNTKSQARMASDALVAD